MASICFAALLISGCGEKEPPSVRQSRAIAAENMELKKQLQRSEDRVEEVKNQYAEELEKQRKLLEKCQTERDQWQEKARRNVRDQVKDVFDSVMAENTRLREENASLREQLQKN